MQATTRGVVSATEAYTLDELALIFNRDRDWVRYTFIRPTDHRTKQRLIDEATGRPVPGVFHFRQGGQYSVPGQALINWMMEHGEQELE